MVDVLQAVLTKVSLTLRLQTLEVSADPYLSICGPPRLSEFRLETAQGFQAIGSVIAPIVAAHAFFNVDASDPRSLVRTFLPQTSPMLR